MRFLNDFTKLLLGVETLLGQVEPQNWNELIMDIETYVKNANL